METRVIPVLLLMNGILYKGVNFKKHKYIGDPINAVKIFNEKEVDELVFLDISATVQKKEPDYKFLADVASQCFMPLCYGGGVKTLTQIEKILYAGVEKISLNTVAVTNQDFVRQAVKEFGSSTIVVSIDAKKKLFGGYSVYIHSGSKNTKLDPLELAMSVADLGIGEILINSIDNDGMMEGYDLKLINSIASTVDVPVIASGGAGSMNHFKDAITEGNASAVSAGSFFVFQGKHRAVLITYPEKSEIESYLNH